MSELKVPPCPGCQGLSLVHNHAQFGDDEDTGRKPLAAAVFLPGLIIAVGMLFLFWKALF